MANEASLHRSSSLPVREVYGRIRDHPSEKEACARRSLLQFTRGALLFSSQGMLSKCITSNNLHFGINLHQTFRDADNSQTDQTSTSLSLSLVFSLGFVAYVLELGVTQSVLTSYHTAPADALIHFRSDNFVQSSDIFSDILPTSVS